MTSPDWIPPERRQRSLTIRSYRVAADGTRYDDTGVVEYDPDAVGAYALHPAAALPPCRCP